ncbi:hypothetical protein PYCC9005_001077 [Savitreella phatthalungensis]
MYFKLAMVAYGGVSALLIAASTEADKFQLPAAQVFPSAPLPPNGGLDPQAPLVES